MGLTGVLARRAVRHAHVLVVEVPGQWLTRCAVERQVRDRGWRTALSPGDADVLVVCGEPGPGLSPLLARLWEQLPGPRSRVVVDSPQAAAAALDRARTQLLDTPRQRADAGTRSVGSGGPVESAVPTRPPTGAAETRHGGHAGSDEAAHHGGHADPDDAAGHGGHGGAGDAGHHGMAGHGHGGTPGTAGPGHGGSGMAPAGIALAEGGPDRDGLDLDELHVRLGPVLAYWPAGLALRCAVQGDVIVDAAATLVDVPPAPAAGGPVPRDDVLRAAYRCDNAAHLLALAGWADAAARARRVRDRLLFAADPGGAAADLDRLRRTVARSRLLRWSLRGLRPLTEVDLARLGLPARLRGDTHDRLCGMFDRAARHLHAGDTAQGRTRGRAGTAEGHAPAEADAATEGPDLDHADAAESRAAGHADTAEGRAVDLVAAAGGPTPGPAEAAVRPADEAGTGWIDHLPGLVRGLDLAAARLVVASLDPDPLDGHGGPGRG